MRKLGLSLVLLGAVAATVAATGTAGTSRSTATFKFCTNATFPPMESKTSGGQTVGFDIDMASALAKTWGDTAQPVETSFDGLIPSLNSKRCDAVISAIFVTPERTKVAGVVPYMQTHRVLIVRSGNPKGIKGPNDLKGKVVAVQSGTKYEEYLKGLAKKLGFTVQSYKGDNDAVAQILLGRADAVLTQDTSYSSQARQHPGKLGIGYTYKGFDSFGLYFRKADESALGQQLKDGMAKLKSNGTLVTLAKKYKLPVNTVQ
jgi:polar amino acid transport system substrate-binding protein